jgi:hypothetical protein
MDFNAKECIMDDIASEIADLGVASKETKGFEPMSELDFPSGKPTAEYFQFDVDPPEV